MMHIQYLPSFLWLEANFYLTALGFARLTVTFYFFDLEVLLWTLRTGLEVE